MKNSLYLVGVLACSLCLLAVFSLTSQWTTVEPLTSDRVRDDGLSAARFQVVFQWGQSDRQAYKVIVHFYTVKGEHSPKLDLTTGRIWSPAPGQSAPNPSKLSTATRETYVSEESGGESMRRDIIEALLKSGLLEKMPTCPDEIPIGSIGHTVSVGDEFIGLEIGLAKGYKGTHYKWVRYCKKPSKEKMDESTKRFFEFHQWLKDKYFVFPPTKWLNKQTEEGGKTTWIHKDR